MSMVARVEAILPSLKMMLLKRKMVQRFDRCCHAGFVSYRLPLSYRITTANSVGMSEANAPTTPPVKTGEG